MDKQATGFNSPEQGGKPQNVSAALFRGCCVIALSIVIAAFVIARQIPHSLHGNLHGIFSGTLMDGGGSFRDFMSEWEAANFLMMSPEQLERIIESGELRGTYTTFQIEHMVWRGPERPGEWIISGDVAAEPVPTPIPAPFEFDIVIVDHRVFSRERLTEWLHVRMDN